MLKIIGYWPIILPSVDMRRRILIFHWFFLYEVLIYSLCFKNYLIVNSCESHAKLLFLPGKISRDIQLKLASHPDLKNNPSASAPKTDKYWNNFFFKFFIFCAFISKIFRITLVSSSFLAVIFSTETSEDTICINSIGNHQLVNKVIVFRGYVTSLCDIYYELLDWFTDDR